MPAARDDAELRLKRLLDRARSTAAAVVTPVERQHMLNEGEAALQRGEAAQALDWFERAGLVQHEADAEIGMIRAMMQAGHYRRALTLAAHTAGAHPASAAGNAMYAGLLFVGGQVQVAQRLLDQAQARLPEEPLLIAMQAQLQQGAMLDAPLMTQPVRFAPYSPDSAKLPRDAVVAGSGVLVDGARRVLVERTAVRGARAIWVRNGIGRVTAASVMREQADEVIAQLELTQPLDAVAAATALRDPFPGSPGFMVEFTTDQSLVLAWPVMRVGFIGTPAGTPGIYRLGIDAPRGKRGGAVFDTAGRLIGIALSDTGAGDTIVLGSRLRQLAGSALAPGTSQATQERLPVDEIYERGMATTVQILILR